MEFRRLKEMTERQFKRVLDREGKKVIKTLTQEEVTVLFRKIQGHSGEHITIYYPYDTNLKKGDIVEYKGYRYLLSEESSIHSDIFKTSTLKKCTVFLNINGRHIPMAFSSDLYTKLSSTVINSLGLVTTDTEHIRDIEKKNKYICFGGTYEVETIFYNDGLAYIYLKRTGDAMYGLLRIQYHGDTTFNLSDNKVQLRFSVITSTDDVVWSGVKLTYKSSNPNFADIDENGWLTMRQKGVITVTASYEDYTLKKTITIR